VARGRLPRAPPPQLPPVRRRAGDLPDRLLDAERGAGVARLPPLRVGVRRRAGGVLGLRADPLLCSRGRRARRPREPSPPADRNADDPDAARARRRDTDRRAADFGPAPHGFRRWRGAGERLRRPGPPGLHRADGRAGGSAERDRAQLLDLQRGAGDRASGRGEPPRRGRRGRVLLLQRRELCGRARGPAAYASPRRGARAPPHRSARQRAPLGRALRLGRTRS